MSILVEHLSPRDSVFAKFDPRWKLAALLSAAAMTVVLSRPAPILLALGLSFCLVLAARLRWSWYAARLRALLFALLPFAFILPLTVSGQNSSQLFGISISAEGFVAAGLLIAKSVAIVTIMLVLLGSSPLHTTMQAAGRLGFPGLLVLLTMLTYRYIFLIQDELRRLRTAMRVRGFRNRMNRHSYRKIGQMTGTLLVRGSERAERVAQAMRCRGFDGQFRSLTDFRTTGRDIGLFVWIFMAYGGVLIWELY